MKRITIGNNDIIGMGYRHIGSYATTGNGTEVMETVVEQQMVEGNASSLLETCDKLIRGEYPHLSDSGIVPVPNDFVSQMLAGESYAFTLFVNGKRMLGTVRYDISSADYDPKTNKFSRGADREDGWQWINHPERGWLWIRVRDDEVGDQYGRWILKNIIKLGSFEVWVED